MYQIVIVFWSLSVLHFRVIVWLILNFCVLYFSEFAVSVDSLKLNLQSQSMIWIVLMVYVDKFKVTLLKAYINFDWQSITKHD